jgi:hypothetical protein
MPTLPDGDSISSQFGPEGWEDLGFSYSSQFGPEGWETLGFSYTQQFPTEGWEKGLLVMRRFTISASSTDVEPGDTVTISGTAEDDTGTALGKGVQWTVELRDSGNSLVDSATGTTDNSGDYSGNIVPPSPGDFDAQTVNDLPGRVISEGWED